MNSDEVFDLIEVIAATSSKTGKQGLIAHYQGDPLFKEVLFAALDPFTTYGMAKVPAAVTEGNFDLFHGGTWEMLDKMAVRQLTGNAAQSEVADAMDNLSGKSRELLRRIITKDLRAGFSESTVNKAIPGLIPTFDCMLAHKFEMKRVKTWPQFVEPKLDGVRVLAFVNLDTVKVSFFSRSGKEFTTFDHLKQPLLNMLMAARSTVRAHHPAIDLVADHMTSMVFDGEIVSGSFNKTVGDVRRKSEQATDAEFHVFDVLNLSDFKQDGKGGCVGAGDYLTRRKTLQNIVGLAELGPIRLIQRYAVSSEAEIHHIYESVRARGLEGLIVKDPSALYHRRRNHGWMKIKAEESEDLTVIGVFEGEGKYEGMLGGLIVDFKGVHVRVGGGFSDAQRQVIWDEYQKDQWNSGVPGYERNVVGRIIEVEYHEVTPDGSLRHPRFVRFRDTLSHGVKE